MRGAGGAERGEDVLGRKINRYTISGAQIHTFRRCNVFAVLQNILFGRVTKTRVACTSARIMWRLLWWEIEDIVLVTYHPRFIPYYFTTNISFLVLILCSESGLNCHLVIFCLKLFILKTVFMLWYEQSYFGIGRNSLGNVSTTLQRVHETPNSFEILHYAGQYTQEPILWGVSSLRYTEAPPDGRLRHLHRGRWNPFVYFGREGTTESDLPT